MSRYCWRTNDVVDENGPNGLLIAALTTRLTNSTASMPGRSDDQPSDSTVSA